MIISFQFILEILFVQILVHLINRIHTPSVLYIRGPKNRAPWGADEYCPLSISLYETMGLKPEYSCLLRFNNESHVIPRAAPLNHPPPPKRSTKK